MSKFHAHITVSPNFVKPDKMQGKMTVIELEKGKQEQTDVMLTQYFNFYKFRSVEHIIDNLKRTVAEIKALGYTVYRIKLEQEDLPTYNPSREHYREYHFKCLLEKGQKELVQNLFPDLVASRNPKETRDDGKTVQFFNARVYKGTVAEADKEYNRVHALMKKAVEVIEMKAETIIWDSNLEHDKWWA